jgi:hypothetical protein
LREQEILVGENWFERWEVAINLCMSYGVSENT